MVRSSTLSEPARQVLAKATASDSAVELPPGQLDRKLYVEVNKALDALGGSWNRSAKAHLFPSDPRAGLETLLATGVIPPREQQSMSYWATPDELADQMVAPFVGYGPSAHTDRRDRRVVEPSAGDGAIVRALRRQAGRYLHIVAVEPADDALRGNQLQEAGADEIHRCTFEQYLEHLRGPVLGFVMNPPFTVPGDHLAYATHLELALDYLGANGGGEVVCVVPAGFEFRQDKRIARLRGRLEDLLGGWSTVPDRAFAGSGTLVNTRLVQVSV